MKKSQKYMAISSVEICYFTWKLKVTEVAGFKQLLHIGLLQDTKFNYHSGSWIYEIEAIKNKQTIEWKHLKNNT